jgi:hypothetical protein
MLDRTQAIGVIQRGLDRSTVGQDVPQRLRYRAHQKKRGAGETVPTLAVADMIVGLHDRAEIGRAAAAGERFAGIERAVVVGQFGAMRGGRVLTAAIMVKDHAQRRRPCRPHHPQRAEHQVHLHGVAHRHPMPHREPGSKTVDQQRKPSRVGMYVMSPTPDSVPRR